MSARCRVAPYGQVQCPHPYTEGSSRAPGLDLAALLLLCFMYIAVGPMPPGQAITQLLLEKLEDLKLLAAGLRTNSDLRHAQYCSACKVRLVLEAWKVSCLAKTTARSCSASDELFIVSHAHERLTARRLRGCPRRRAIWSVAHACLLMEATCQCTWHWCLALTSRGW